MTKAQRIILVIGLLMMSLAALFPNFDEHVTYSMIRPGVYGRGRKFLFSSSGRHVLHVNLSRLLAEWMVIATFTGAGMLLFHGRKPRPPKGD